MMQIHHCEQGSDEWLRVRAGIATASEFSSILAKGEGKTRRSYMLKLAGEIITGEPTESFTNANMERGKVMEASAREYYAFLKDVEPDLVGFITNGPKGCSPDALVGNDGLLEIKTALPHIQIDRLLKNELPPEHKAQCQGALWVSEREWLDFISYWPKCPPLIVRVQRDEAYIRDLSAAVNLFNAELAEVVEKVRGFDLARAA